MGFRQAALHRIPMAGNKRDFMDCEDQVLTKHQVRPARYGAGGVAQACCSQWRCGSSSRGARFASTQPW